MKRMYLRNVSLALFTTATLFVMTSCNNKGVLIADHFEEDAAGWQIMGDAKGSSGAEPQYESEGGVSNGFIHAKDDVSGGVWYFEAPDRYLGDKSEFYGATLSYSLYQHAAISSQFDREDVIFKNGDQQIYYVVDEFPDTSWTAYRVKIDTTANWQKGTFKGEHEKATKEDMMEVLSHVTDFWIRGEYETGPDEDGLDDVVIKL